MKKLSLFLAIVLLLSASTGLVSCSSGDEVTETTSSETVAETEAAAEETALSDDLPDIKFDGKELRVATDSRYVFEINAAEMTGDLENDAIYDRNMRIGERFDAKIQNYDIGSSSADCYNAIVTSVTAGDDQFDLGGFEVWNFSIAAANKVYTNWLDIPHINPAKPWWNSYINDSSTINGKLFGLTGHLSLTYLQNIVTVYFNTDLSTNAGYPSDALYKIVNDGQWTIDKAGALSEEMYVDINGDGTVNEGDQYGFIVPYVEALDNFGGAFGIQLLSKDADGKLTHTMLSEASLNGFQKIYKFMCETNGVVVPAGISGINGSQDSVFLNNQSVFFASPIQLAFSSFRDMESPYGMLPMPKYDESQARYYSPVADNYNIFGVPKTAVANAEFIGVMTEAMAAENYQTVYPVYYEDALRGKYSQDEATAEMVHLIVENAGFDLAMMYGTYLARMPYKYRDHIGGKNNDITSSYAAIQQEVEYNLGELYKFYE